MQFSRAKIHFVKAVLSALLHLFDYMLDCNVSVLTEEDNAGSEGNYDGYTVDVHLPSNVTLISNIQDFNTGLTGVLYHLLCVLTYVDSETTL